MKHFPMRADGGFRICQLTDLHLEHDDSIEEGKQTYALIQNVIRDTSPDLVAVTGDLAWGTNSEAEIARFGAAMEEAGLCWTMVLGNHDGEEMADGGIAGRRMCGELLMGCKGCLFEPGPDEVAGTGNYTVTVGGTPEAPVWVLYHLDNHRGDFDISQLLWYKQTSQAFGEAHHELAFFHVPIHEYRQVWDYGECVGMNQEQVATADINSGLFAVMARRGRMRGTFVGHDHVNDFEGTLKGIRLCFGRNSGYQGRGMHGFDRGARIIDLNADGTFDTQIYTSLGGLYRQTRTHPPKLGSKC